MTKTPIYPTLEQAATLRSPRVSFEFFPPKTDEAEEKLWLTINELAALRPEFISVTYGAGGSTRDRTQRLVRRIRDNAKVKPAAHLTCVGASREEIDAIARQYWDDGIKHIVALRGDMPGDQSFVPHPQGYAYADDLVKGLKRIGDFEISVAAYPETHPQAVSPQADIEHLKRKIDAGATRAITQYFFNVEDYFRFIDKVRKAGITAPIVPGVLCISGYAQLIRFSKMCGASVPGWVQNLLEPAAQDPAATQRLALLIAQEQALRLVAAGVEQLHFYTLNNADIIKTVCHSLNIR